MDLYLDVTESMAGFLRPGPNAQYGYIVQAAEDVAQRLTSQGVRLFRFGTVIEAWPTSKITERFDLSSYGKKRGFEDNDLSVVLTQLDPARVSIVVSDLFQSDNDIGKVSSVLLDRFQALGDTGAVGVVGCRARFAGTIFDIGPQRTTLPYSGDRPIYLLLLGNATGVERMAAGIRNELASKSVACEAAVFSSRLTENPGRMREDGQPVQLLGVDRDSSILTRDDERVLPLRMVASSTSGSARFKRRVEFTSLSSYHPEPGPVQGRVRWESWAPEKGKGTWEPKNSPIAVAGHLQAVPDAKGAFVLDARVSIGTVPRGTHRGEIIFGPTPEEFGVPDWIRQRSFTGMETPEGSKTLNLARFFANASGALSPAWFRGYIYLRKE